MIIAALQSKVSNPQSNPFKRRKEQDFMTFMDFLTQMTWDIQLDPNASPVAKRDQLCCALVHLKCPNPSAHTLKLATSLHLMCGIGFEAAMSKSQTEKGKEKESFAKELKRYSRNVTVDPEQYVLKLPPRPADLQRVNPVMYGEIYNDVYGYPVLPQVPVAKVVAIYETFNCRNNDREKHGTALARSVPQTATDALPSQQSADMMGLMFNFMQTMITSSAQPRPRDEIPIDYGLPRGRLAGVAAQIRSTPVAPAENSPRGPPLLGIACANARSQVRR